MSAREQGQFSRQAALSGIGLSHQQALAANMLTRPEPFLNEPFLDWNFGTNAAGDVLPMSFRQAAQLALVGTGANIPNFIRSMLLQLHATNNASQLRVAYPQQNSVIQRDEDSLALDAGCWWESGSAMSRISAIEAEIERRYEVYNQFLSVSVDERDLGRTIAPWDLWAAWERGREHPETASKLHFPAVVVLIDVPQLEEEVEDVNNAHRLIRKLVNIGRSAGFFTVIAGEKDEARFTSVPLPTIHRTIAFRTETAERSMDAVLNTGLETLPTELGHGLYEMSEGIFDEAEWVRFRSLDVSGVAKSATWESEDR